MFGFEDSGPFNSIEIGLEIKPCYRAGNTQCWFGTLKILLKLLNGWTGK